MHISADVIDSHIIKKINNPAGIYLFKVNDRNSRTKCEICSKLTIKTLELRQTSKMKSFEL